MGMEKLESHIFKYVEKELYYYPINKRFIENWERESQDIAGATQSALGKDSDRFSQNKITDPTYSRALKLQMMSPKVDRAKMYVRAVEAVMETLNDADRRLVKLKYFDGLLTNAGVARELNMDIKTFYSRRKKLMEKFAYMMGLV